MNLRLYVGVVGLLVIVLSTSPNITDPVEITAGKQTTHSLSEEDSHRGIYRLSLDQEDMPDGNPQKWFLFVMTEPTKKSIGTPSKMVIETESKNGETKKVKECAIEEDSDACFLKSNQLNFKKQNVLISVFCPEDCQFSLMTEVDISYRLSVNQFLELDFQDTAYTKVFTLETQGEDFDELRVILKPKAFLNYPEPIILLANFGKEIPTHDKHDFKGLHLWDDGQGIFIDKMDMKNSVLTILVEGPEKNVLQLHNQLRMQEQVNNLTRYSPYFDHIKTNQIHTYGILLESDESDIPFFIKVTTFTGAIQSHQLYKVSPEGRRSEVTLSTPVTKYGEFEIRLSPEQIRKQSLKYIEIELQGKKESTYLIEYYPQNNKISLLRPLISKSSVMEYNQTDQYAIHVRELIEKDKNSSQVEVVMDNIEGEIETSFYSCSYHDYEKCLITEKSDKKIQKIKPTVKSKMNGKIKYWFDVPVKQFQEEEGKDIVIYRMVAVVKNIDEGEAKYEIQYKNKARIHLLKEGKTQNDRIDIKQKRYYTFTNMDKNVYEIRVHLSMISGLVEFVGSYEDPRMNNQINPIEPIHKILYFKNRPLNNIYVKVEGLENAYYSISVQVMRKSQDSTDKNSTEGFNQMVVREGVPYEFTIAPQEKIVLQLSPSSKSFALHMSASLPLEVCMTEKISSPPFEPNCEVLMKNMSKQAAQIRMNDGYQANFGITNPNNRSVSFQLGYSSEQALCYEAKLGEIMEKELFEGGQDLEGQTEHCLVYMVNRYDDLEVTVRFSNHQYLNGSISIRINHEIVKMTSPIHLFDKHEVEAACKKNDDEDTEHLCFMQVLIENISNTVVDVVVQYVDDEIKLLDGIAHEVHSLIKKNEPRKFVYWLPNPTNTSVFLESIRGRYKIYGLFVNHTEYMTILKNEKLGKNAFPSTDKNHFVSANPFYYLEQVKDISAKDVQNYCDSGDSRDCLLLLSVYLDEDNEVQTNGRFRVEITQQSRRLKENEPVASYLEKGSVEFFEFKNVDQNGTIIIEINNENKRCIDIYAREDGHRATSSSNDAKAKSSNQLIIKKAKKGNYGITVQANQNCPYIIEVSSNPNAIATIRKGKFSDIQLEEYEQYNLLFENLIDENFKVLSVHKSGEVLISVKTISREKLEEELEKKVDQMKDWQWRGKDQVRIDHLDKSGKPAKNYCSDCFYLINIEAQRKTEASILIPTPGVQIPISTDLMIKDLLLKKEKTTYRIFTDSKGKFEIYLQYGILNLTIIDSELNETKFTKIYKAQKQPKLEEFNLDNDKTYEYRRFSRVILEAEQDTLFSFAVISEEDSEIKGDRLQYGIPSYLFMKKNQQKCVNGTLEKSGQNFLISFSDTEKNIANQIKIDLKINKKSLKTQKETAINEILLTIPKGQITNKSADYEMCLKSPEDIILTVVQSSPIIYFPERETMLIKEQINLTFGSSGKNILELNQCNGRAIASISSEFNSLGSLTSEINQVRRANNIIEFSYYGPLFLNVKVDKGTIAWRNYDDSLNIGTGYDEYQAGWLRINKNKKNNSLTVMAQALVPMPKSKTYNKVQQITYRFFVGKEQADLYSAMNCNEGENPVKEYTVTDVSKLKQEPKVSFDIEKDLQGFKRYSYFLIGMKAEVKMKNPQDTLESYRFFYPYQQVLKSMLSGDKVTPKPPVGEQIDYFTIFLWLGIAVALGCCIFLYKRVTRKKVGQNYENAGLEMKYSEWGSNR